jgi:hypothetical protein
MTPSAPTCSMSRRVLVILTAWLWIGSTLQAQAPWPTSHQMATWLTTTVEQPIGGGRSLWFDGNWRRMGIGAEPQQVLLRPGFLWTIVEGVRAGAGYVYAATAPYGELPTPTPLREHRLWQQIAFAYTLGDLGVQHRIRTEQRWIYPLVQGEWERPSYQNRVRLMGRGQLPTLFTVDDRRITLFVQEELFVNIGHGGPAARLTQNRLGGGFGVPLSARQRLDIGYMNLWNPITSRSANESNHTLTVNWVFTGG